MVRNSLDKAALVSFLLEQTNSPDVYLPNRCTGLGIELLPGLVYFFLSNSVSVCFINPPPGVVGNPAGLLIMSIS